MAEEEEEGGTGETTGAADTPTIITNRAEVVAPRPATTATPRAETLAAMAEEEGEGGTIPAPLPLVLVVPEDTPRPRAPVDIRPPGGPRGARTAGEVPQRNIRTPPRPPLAVVTVEAPTTTAPVVPVEEEGV